MSKKDLIDAVAEAAELSKDKAGVAVEAVIKHIEKTMKDGQEVRTGERYGLIRFGSRLDIYLPRDAEPLVIVGQTAIGGETVLVDFESSEAARTGLRD